jgi:transposase
MSVSEDYARWNKTVKELCRRHKALHNFDQQLLSLYTLVRFVLCNKQYLNMMACFHRVKMYHGAIKHIERIYSYSNIPRTYHLLMDELIG